MDDAAFAGMTIRRLSTADQVCDAVRDRIVAGALPPGTPLREVLVAESLGVSRNTVREAFRLLAREGLVRHTMHRGVMVTQLDEAEVRDLYRVRRTLESAGLAALPEDRFDELDDACRALDKAVRAGGSREIVDADFLFHRLLVEGLESPRLLEFFMQSLSELRIALSIADRRREQDRVFARDHVAMVQLLRDGDRAAAEASLLRHLDISCDVALRIVGER
jgi:DNA-binding GntR family transcriptional regulator